MSEICAKCNFRLFECDCPKPSADDSQPLNDLLYFVVVDGGETVKQITHYFDDLQDAKNWIEHFQPMPSWKDKRLRVVKFIEI